MSPPPRARPLAVVTGASSGIGRALAEGLATRGYDLVLVARREALLSELAASLHGAHGVECEPFVADLAKYAERERLSGRLERQSDRLDVLVNNAGFGTHGFFHETDLDRELELIDVNCSAPVHLTKRVLPWMLARRRGFVLNVASLSAFTPGPVMNLYYSSKAFLLSFSEALWEECRGSGVVVTALCPGPVRTGFQAAAGLASTARTSGPPAMPVEVVAREGLRGLFAGQRRVVPGFANKWAVFLARFLPRGAALASVRRIQEARRRQTRIAKGLEAEG